MTKPADPPARPDEGRERLRSLVREVSRKRDCCTDPAGGCDECVDAIIDVLLSPTPLPGASKDTR